MRPTHLALAAIAVVTTLASAQNGVQANVPGAGFDTPATATPTLHVYSRETIVDVLVTDDKGNAVTGLKQSDFTVKEDGNPQPIRSFHEYTRETPHSSPTSLPPNTWSNATTLPTSGPVQIFLFDRIASAPADLQRSKQYIASYFRTMTPGTTVALFNLSPSKGLRLLQGFTSDGALAASAVENLDVEWFPEPGAGLPDAIAACNQIAAYVAGIHGRKNFVWILNGVPPLIVHDGGLSWGNLDMTYVHRLMDLYDIFTREQIAIYPFHPQGVHQLFPFGKALQEIDIADGTGGAISNSNDYKSTIAKIVDDSSHGYTLSYVPPRPDTDGHFHPITITVDRPGLHLNYRTGYNDELPNPPDGIVKAHMIQGPMRLGAMPATQLIFQMHVEPGASSTPAQPGLVPASAQPATPHTKGAPYDTIFTFDPTQIALAQNPDGTRTASIELDLGAFDFYGKLVAARSQTFKITVTPAQYESFYRKPIQFPLAIDLTQGQLTLRAGVLDSVGNKVGTVEVPLTVPKR